MGVVLCVRYGRAPKTVVAAAESGDIRSSIHISEDPVNLALVVPQSTLLRMDTGAVFPDQPSDDAALCGRLQDGDDRAYEDLMRKYGPQLMAYVKFRVGSGSDAEDMCQEVWMRVWKNRHTFDGRHFRGWLFQMAKNLIVDRGRQSSRRGNAAALESLPDSSGVSTPGHDADREEELAALSECIQSVGGDFIHVLRRVKLDNEAVQDVADDLGITPGNVYKQVFHAKQQLADCLKTKLK